MKVNDTAVDWCQSVAGNHTGQLGNKLGICIVQYNLYAISYNFIYNFAYRISNSLVTVHFSLDIWSYGHILPGQGYYVNCRKLSSFILCITVL